MKFFKVKRSFWKEFRRQLKLAITAAIGFSVAFAWKDAIQNSSQEILKKVSSQSVLASIELSSAFLITLLGVLLLFTTSKILK